MLTLRAGHVNMCARLTYKERRRVNLILYSVFILIIENIPPFMTNISLLVIFLVAAWSPIGQLTLLTLKGIVYQLVDITSADLRIASVNVPGHILTASWKSFPAESPCTSLPRKFAALFSLSLAVR